MSFVHYKFKSSLDYDSVTFDGLRISLGDLKKAIIHQKKLGKAAEFDLQIKNAQTMEEYRKDDELIPKNASVIVARVPIAGVEKAPTKTWEPTLEDMIGPDGRPMLSFDTLSQTADLANAHATENDKILAMMAQSTKTFDPTNYMQNTPSGPPPPNYVCYRCRTPGHYIQNCTKRQDPGYKTDLRPKRSTGIPNSFLTVIRGPAAPGLYMTSSGEYALPTIDANAYIKGKKGAARAFAAQEFSDEDDDNSVPEELLCLLCKDLLQDAVIIRCCGNSYCDECVRNALLETEEHECPTCQTTDISPDSLIPNRLGRTAVQDFLNETGYTKIKRPYKKAAPPPPPIVQPSPKRQNVPKQIVKLEARANSPPHTVVKQEPPKRPPPEVHRTSSIPTISARSQVRPPPVVKTPLLQTPPATVQATDVPVVPPGTNVLPPVINVPAIVPHATNVPPPALPQPAIAHSLNVPPPTLNIQQMTPPSVRSASPIKSPPPVITAIAPAVPDIPGVDASNSDISISGVRPSTPVKDENSGDDVTKGIQVLGHQSYQNVQKPPPAVAGLNSAAPFQDYSRPPPILPTPHSSVPVVPTYAPPVQMTPPQGFRPHHASSGGPPLLNGPAPGPLYRPPSHYPPGNYHLPVHPSSTPMSKEEFYRQKKRMQDAAAKEKSHSASPEPDSTDKSKTAETKKREMLDDFAKMLNVPSKKRLKSRSRSRSRSLPRRPLSHSRSRSPLPSRRFSRSRSRSRKRSLSRKRSFSRSRSISRPRSRSRGRSLSRSRSFRGYSRSRSRSRSRPPMRRYSRSRSRSPYLKRRPSPGYPRRSRTPPPYRSRSRSPYYYKEGYRREMSPGYRSYASPPRRSYGSPPYRMEEYARYTGNPPVDYVPPCYPPYGAPTGPPAYGVPQQYYDREHPSRTRKQPPPRDDYKRYESGRKEYPSHEVLRDDYKRSEPSRDYKRFSASKDEYDLYLKRYESGQEAYKRHESTKEDYGRTDPGRDGHRRKESSKLDRKTKRPELHEENVKPRESSKPKRERSEVKRERKEERGRHKKDRSRNGDREENDITSQGKHSDSGDNMRRRIETIVVKQANEDAQSPAKKKKVLKLKPKIKQADMKQVKEANTIPAVHTNLRRVKQAISDSQDDLPPMDLRLTKLQASSSSSALIVIKMEDEPPPPGVPPEEIIEVKKAISKSPEELEEVTVKPLALKLKQKKVVTTAERTESDMEKKKKRRVKRALKESKVQEAVKDAKVPEMSKEVSKVQGEVGAKATPPVIVKKRVKKVMEPVDNSQPAAVAEVSSTSVPDELPPPDVPSPVEKRDDLMRSVPEPSKWEREDGETDSAPELRPVRKPEIKKLPRSVIESAEKAITQKPRRSTVASTITSPKSVTRHVFVEKDEPTRKPDDEDRKVLAKPTSMQITISSSTTPPATADKRKRVDSEKEKPKTQTAIKEKPVKPREEKPSVKKGVSVKRKSDEPLERDTSHRENKVAKYTDSPKKQQKPQHSTIVKPRKIVKIFDRKESVVDEAKFEPDYNDSSDNVSEASSEVRRRQTEPHSTVSSRSPSPHSEVSSPTKSARKEEVSGEKKHKHKKQHKKHKHKHHNVKHKKKKHKKHSGKEKEANSTRQVSVK